jgi:hypothetical protein
MRWPDYIRENERGGRLDLFPNWETTSRPWECIRSDGLMSAHHAESPCCSRRETMERSMRLADVHIPLGAGLPPGMRTREDPLYDGLWETEQPGSGPRARCWGRGGHGAYTARPARPSSIRSRWVTTSSVHAPLTAP